MKCTLIVFYIFCITTLNAQNYEWTKIFGGDESDWGNSIFIDVSGNIYTTGRFGGTVDFDPGAGISNLTSVGNNDVFVQKMDSSGNFLWAKSFGGMSSEVCNSITVDAFGNVYTTGVFLDTADFDSGPGTSHLFSAGGWDIFVQKMDASGNFLWAKSIGGVFDEEVRTIRIDPSGNIYIIGSFEGTVDFDPGSGTSSLTSVGQYDIFVLKMDASGNFFWIKSFGGSNRDTGSSICIDASGSVYSAGFFKGIADFDPGAGISNLTSAGHEDIFVQKMDSSGNFLWAKSFGGIGFDECYSICLDASANVYTTGVFFDTVDMDPGAGTYNHTSAGQFDSFVHKMDSSGNFLWARSFGGVSQDISQYISVDASGNVYTTGYFNLTVDFDPGAGISYHTSAGEEDVFILKMDSLGNFLWAITFGGSYFDFGNGLGIDASGNVYTIGIFIGTVDFDPGVGTNIFTSAGFTDIFVQKISQPIVGLIENTFDQEIKVFPSPSNGNFSIDLGNDLKSTIITITDNTGKLIHSNLTFQNQIINFTIEEPAGIYFVIIHSGEKNAVFKLVKE